MLRLDQINNITIEALEKYLVKNSWKQDINFINKKIKLYKKIIDDDEYTLFLPARNNFKDVGRKISETIEILSELQEITNQKLISEILKENNEFILVNKEIVSNEVIKQNKDILSFRIISKLSNDGRIPLEYGANVIEGLKKLVLSAIFNEEYPQPFFLRHSKKSQEQLWKYKLAQTQVGSYIFNIEIDNEIDNGEQLEFNDNEQIEVSLSQERKVIKRIQNGILKIKENNIEELFKNSYKRGLNANMCDALLNLQMENYDIKIESKVEWSDLLPKPNDVKEKVILESNDFYKVKILSEKYKETKSVEHTIMGKIIRLSNRKDSHGNSIERNIVIQTEIEGKSKNIKIELSDDDYKIACEAHKQDKDVLINGEILKQGKSWIMINYKKFKIL
ncbi:hypothetical protein [Clostridium botulinum]|uniref:Uncharacterized protein n=1 Tax=Clostridium botulinum TaxID=1491 RepID=A0A6B4JP23_CLOBO|nr:hypothetical protein [Clostridium botulinum]EES48991.1 conserved hypothetical protein [Clostridium botulinum E1 str. 'BoNT E Beluga']MBY6761883.1 hypothetical protein [Clostridium botulinum]MBY6920809.1 hypothetical protein [Clostridium botulinum]MCR1131442.1 hypothetical protein [Clostridium botulinum]NFG21981.1 hypothetical protein [Clostridium botulinum]